MVFSKPLSDQTVAVALLYNYEFAGPVEASVNFTAVSIIVHCILVCGANPSAWCQLSVSGLMMM